MHPSLKSSGVVLAKRFAVPERLRDDYQDDSLCRGPGLRYGSTSRGPFSSGSGACPMSCRPSLSIARGVYLSQVLAKNGLTSDVAGTMQRTKSTVANVMPVPGHG